MLGSGKTHADQELGWGESGQIGVWLGSGRSDKQPPTKAPNDSPGVIYKRGGGGGFKDF